MSEGKKVLILGLTLTVIAFLSSCAGASVQNADLIYSAEVENSQLTSSSSVVKTAVCEIGDVLTPYTMQVRMHYPVDAIYPGGEDTGYITEIFPDEINNREFKKGDPILKISYNNDNLYSEREKILFNLDYNEKAFETETSAKQDSIAEMAEQLSGMNAQEADLQRIRIEKAKLELEMYLYNYERQTYEMKKNLEEIEKKLQGILVTAPFDGVIINFYLKKDDKVEPNTRLMDIYRKNIFLIGINGDNQKLIYNSKVMIDVEGEDKKYPAQVITDLSKAGEVAAFVEFDEPYNNDGNVRANASAVNGQSMYISGVTVVHKDAVKPEENRRYVMLIEDGVIKKRYVQTGVIGSTMIEIITGLKPGDVVLQQSQGKISRL